GLKSLGMDHGNPTIDGHKVWFCSDEHVTFATEKVDDAERDGAARDESARGDVAKPAGRAPQPAVGSKIRVTPAHVDPTMAMHDHVWLVRGDEVLDRWPIDLRGW
ncbi:MAG: hypothetical protein ACKOYI_10375, partial [Actinomycetota bacterium]